MEDIYVEFIQIAAQSYTNEKYKKVIRKHGRQNVKV